MEKQEEKKRPGTPALDIKDIFTRIYYDQKHPAGYGSINGLYKAARALDKNVTRQDTEKWLREQNVFTLHAAIKRNFQRRKTIAKGLHYQMQLDLVDLSNISTANKGYKFLLTAIDVFSRKAFVEPLKSKRDVEVKDAIAKIFSNYPPVRYIQTDLGKEFHNKLVKDYLTSRNIKLFSTSSDTKSAIVERFNKTLKQKMFKYFTANNTISYIDVLSDFVAAYNNRYHRSIGMAPNSVTYKNQSRVWCRQYGEYMIGYRKSRFKYNVNDRVRISKIARTFRKGYLPSYTDEVFVVHERLATTPVTYRLRDKRGEILIGTFYQPELELVLFLDS